MANSFITERKPVELRGYFMRHKTGGDVGFSWKKDDPKFSGEWERIAAVPEAPSSATTAGGERQNQADESNVLPPFAAPASQRDAGTTVLTMDQVAEIMRACNVNYSPVMAAFARTLEAEVVSRCRAQGGNTIIDHDINGKPVYLATPANTAPAVQPDPVEVRAKEIYATFEGSERHPWIERGNSLMQDKARRLARAEVRDSAKESAEGSGNGN